MNYYIDITASKIVNSKGWIPKNIFLTKGTGIHNEKLASFELALRSAGIASYNLISVSSILPPNCDIIDQSDGVKMLQPGQVVPVVLARSESKKPDILVSSGVGIAVPKNRNEKYLIKNSKNQIIKNSENLENLISQIVEIDNLIKK